MSKDNITSKNGKEYKSVDGSPWEEVSSQGNSKSEDTSLDDLIKDLRTENSNSFWQEYCDEVEAKINRLMLEARLAGAIDCATWVMQHDESSFRQERAWFKVKPALFLKYQAELLKELQELSNNLKEGI
jgi:hypothetical protein